MAYTLSSLPGPYGLPLPRDVALLVDRVIAKHPQLFGVDSPAQRQRWAAELRWAWTIVNTRCYGARAGGEAPWLPGVSGVSTSYDGVH